MNDRLAPNHDEEAFPVERIELQFAIPVYLTIDDQTRLNELMDRIVERPCNQLADGVHWCSGGGSKPTWSQMDARFLGRPIDPAAPETGEPTFDDSVFFLETTAREFIDDEERKRVLERRMK